MSCFDDKKTLGMVRVETSKVIVACNKTLKRIYAHRSKARRDYCQDWLDSSMKKWKILWRWFGFSKPTFRDAIYDYYHKNKYPPVFTVSMAYSIQEDECEKLLRAAKATDGLSMWLSVNGANVCGV